MVANDTSAASASVAMRIGPIVGEMPAGWKRYQQSLQCGAGPLFGALPRGDAQVQAIRIESATTFASSPAARCVVARKPPR